MTKQEIDFIVAGLVETVGSRNVHDIIDHLNIKVICDAPIDTLFIRYNEKEYIFLSKDTPTEMFEFSLAHEIGHAVLHDVEMWVLSKLDSSKHKYELEADYFAFKLLNKEIDLSYNYTAEQYAKDLCVSEKVIKYVVGE